MITTQAGGARGRRRVPRAWRSGEGEEAGAAPRTPLLGWLSVTRPGTHSRNVMAAQERIPHQGFVRRMREA